MVILFQSMDDELMKCIKWSYANNQYC